jgi:hypothetical protein
MYLKKFLKKNHNFITSEKDGDIVASFVSKFSTIIFGGVLVTLSFLFWLDKSGSSS